MPRGSERLTADRREEIINACAALYQTMRFQEITLKKIGEVTTFTRTSIYNYFRTKEEIFLALLQREYSLWTERLLAICAEHETLPREELADVLARSVEERRDMLKLLSMNLYDIEENSSLTRLVEFKRVFGASRTAVLRCLAQFCPEMDAAGRQAFLDCFFPFVQGIYPYAVATEKQLAAVAAAGMEFTCHSIYEIAFAGTKKFLGI